jgi:hypothetical protein
MSAISNRLALEIIFGFENEVAASQIDGIRFSKMIANIDVD